MRPKLLFLVPGFLLVSVFYFVIMPLFNQALAANYYVATNGSDSASGTLSAPWKTVQKAANTIVAGDTAYIRGGVYMEKVYISKSGTNSAPINIKAYPGETPVIDGNNYTMATNWGVLVNLAGNYINLSGVEIRYSGGMGLGISGDYNTADSINSHHNKENGILIMGDYDIVENSRVWSNALTNVNGGSSTGWSSGLSAARQPNNAIIRKNIVYGNWGEGLSTYEATGTVIEDNIIYDNWSVNAYISDATHVLFQRNIVYATGDMVGGGQAGIMMGDEKQVPAGSSDNTIINNFVYNTNRNFYWWRNSIFTIDGLRNTLIANNTFVNSKGTAGVVIAPSPDHSNTKFINNIILQEGSLPVGIMATGIQYGNNLWSKAPSGGVGAGDVNLSGDSTKITQLITRTGSTGAGALTADWFKLTANSAAINKGSVLSEVSKDFFGHLRGSSPDIGGDEYESGGTLPPSLTPTPIITPSLTPTSIPTPTATPQSKRGDSNGDNVVDESDYSIWHSHFNFTGAGGFSIGDFNIDTKVDGIDYAIWLNNYDK